MIQSSSGSWSMTSSVLSSCSWSSAISTFAPESVSRYCTSAAGLVGYSPIVMPRIATVAMSQYSHSRRFSEWMATRSPGSTPSDSRPWATSRTVSQYIDQVTSCHTPKSFSRMAMASGVPCARSRIRVASVAVAVGAAGVSMVAVISDPPGWCCRRRHRCRSWHRRRPRCPCRWPGPRDRASRPRGPGRGRP